MQLEDIKGLLVKIAPSIAAAFGTPAAGAAVALLCHALELPADSAPEQITNAMMNATPAQIDAIRQAENNFALAFAKNDSDDRANARENDNTAITKSPAWAAALSAVVRPAWALGCFTVFVHDAWENIEMVGSVKDVCEIVLTYYFGSRLIEKVLPSIAGAWGKK